MAVGSKEAGDTLKDEEKKQLAGLFSDYDSRYDEKLKLLGEKCRSRGYHTRVESGAWVHSMERSLLYAAGLMDSGEAERIKRACDILREALKHQDQKPDSKTFGIWPYFYEEPLEKMDPPDYNSADFCCKMILQILLDYESELDEELSIQARQACIYGCQSIIRRDAPVQYTNIAVMDCYVCAMTGLLCERKDLYDYGVEKLQRFWTFTKSNGGFQEYNSPNYTLLTAKDLSLFRNQVKDQRLAALLDELLDFTWDSISAHFYEPSGEWMGPNARCYEDFLTDENLTDLEIATDNIGGFTSNFKINLFTYRNRLCCPEKYRERFHRCQCGFFQRLNARGFLYPYFSFAQLSSCFVTEEYALGTFNRSEFWNQIRPLKAHFGGRKTCLRLQVLHDGYDFASAMLHCVQYENRVLGIVNLSDDRGDTHVNLDRIRDKRICAGDLRIRFGVYGQLDGVSVTAREDGAAFAVGGAGAGVRILAAVFGEEIVACETGSSQDCVFYDVILYHGKRKEIDLAGLSGAACGFFLQLGRKEDFQQPGQTETEENFFSVQQQNGRLKIGAAAKQENIPDMSVEAAAKPVPFLENAAQDAQQLGGMRLEDYAAQRRDGKGQLLERVADRILSAGGNSRWEMDIGHFDWVPGVGLYGLYRAWKATGKDRYLKFLISWAEEHLREAFLQKTVNSSAPLLTILALYEETGRENYLDICQKLADEIILHAPLTADGGLEHTVTEAVEGFSDQVWADTLFMVCIFLCRLGKLTGECRYTDFSVRQLRIHHRLLRDEKLGIYYHGWDGKARNHMSGAHWARANAWVLYSTVEILCQVGDFEGREEIESFLEEQSAALLQLQKENGMFTTLLEDPCSYEEISATAGIVAGIRRAVIRGLLSSEYDIIFQKAAVHFPDWIGSGGEVMGVSTGTPVMPDLDGYRTVPIRETLYGQGLMLLALAEQQLLPAP